MIKRISPRPLILGVIVLISLLGGMLAIYTTANGPWGYTDPVIYISTARSLDHGLGFGYYEGNANFTPISLEAPFYSVILSVIGLFGVNLVVAARWLNILAFVFSIFLAGWIFFRFTRAPALGIIASILMCAFPYMVVMFSSAYSEPLFILVFLTGGTCLLIYLQKGKPRFLILSALLVGLIPLARYAGLGIIAAGAISVLLFAAGRAWSRTKKALLFLLVSSLPILAWLGWVYLSTPNSLGGRSVGVELSGLAAQFQTFRGAFMDIVWMWVPFQSNNTLLPYKVRFILLGAGLTLVVGLALLANQRLRKRPEQESRNSGLHVFSFFGLSALMYLAVVIVSYLFTRPMVDIDNRMLLPFYAGMVMSLVGAFALWQAAWFTGRWWAVAGVAWLAAGLCVAWYLPQTQAKVAFFHQGDGLTAYKWGRSAIIQAVSALPANRAVISNDWELLTLWTGHPIHGVWGSFPSEAPIQTTAYGTDPRDATQTLFCQEGAALVIFDDFPTEFRAQVGETYLDRVPMLFAGLTVYGKYSDGVIYLCH